MFYLSGLKPLLNEKMLNTLKKQRWRRKRNFESFFKPFLHKKKLMVGIEMSFKIFTSLPSAALHLAFDSGWM